MDQLEALWPFKQKEPRPFLSPKRKEPGEGAYLRGAAGSGRAGAEAQLAAAWLRLLGVGGWVSQGRCVLHVAPPHALSTQQSGRLLLSSGASSAMRVSLTHTRTLPRSLAFTMCTHPLCRPAACLADKKRPGGCRLTRRVFYFTACALYSSIFAFGLTRAPC